MTNAKKFGLAVLLMGVLTADPLILRLVQEGELTITVVARDSAKVTFGQENKLYKNLQLVAKNLEARQRFSGVVLAAISDVH